jgi:hypothetical protein
MNKISNIYCVLLRLLRSVRLVGLLCLLRLSFFFLECTLQQSFALLEKFDNTLQKKANATEGATCFLAKVFLDKLL